MTIDVSTTPHPGRRKRRLRLALALLAAGTASPAMAQAAPRQVDGEKILELLVQKGVIARGEADAIIAEATVAPPAAAAVTAPPADGVQRVPYVPEIVRKQIKDELRTEVLAQARTEGWAAPGETAEWTKRITLSGDVRVRGEGILFEEPEFADNPTNPNGAPIFVGGNFPNFADFQAINSGPGFDLNGNLNAPFLNTSEDRRRALVRARLGVGVRIDDWVSAELRVATGNDNGPVSTNQTLGAGAEFGKYQLWLDRAAIRLTPFDGVAINLGRAANPFWSTPLQFDEDLNFDGISVTGRGPVTDGVTLFSALGAFPVYNTDFNFGTTDTVKTASRDKYLLAAQTGAEIAASDQLKLAAAVGFFHYTNIQGELSSPCLATLDICDSDVSRPQFIQFGNTLRPIRDIVIDPDQPDGRLVQYFGLSSGFEILNVRGQLDYALSDDLGLRLEGDFAKNLAFDRDEVIARGPVNNLGDANAYVGGDTGWYANLIAGHMQLTGPGDWQVAAGYRHIESDAVLDALNDSDFHLGGTNAKGFTLSGAYGLARNTSVGARWLSANEVSGPPYAVDVIQLDLTTKF